MAVFLVSWAIGGTQKPGSQVPSDSSLSKSQYLVLIWL